MPDAGLRKIVASLRTTSALQEALTQTGGQLLQRYVATRDEVAFEALVRRHGPMVLGVCRRLLTNPCDAEDAFQATFLVLARKAHTVVPRENVAGWLYGVAYRAAQKARATITRRRTHERQLPTLPERPTVADGLWHDLVPLLDQELSRLPDKYRLPLLLCDLESRTRAEAADSLGWPVGTVAGRLARGRALLARRLARHGLPLSGGVLAAVFAKNTASASVPLTLMAATRDALGVFAGGPPAAATASAVSLSRGVLQAMFWKKLIFPLAGALLAALTFGSAGVLMRNAYANESAKATQNASSVEQPTEDERAGVQKPDPPESAADKELKALQGKWKVVALEANGRKAAPDGIKDMRWTFKGAYLEGSEPGGESKNIGEVKLDPGKDPKQIDLVAVEGPTKGKTIQGIYKLEKNRLTVCLRDPEKGRPTEFSAAETKGVEQGVITLERIEEAPKPENAQGAAKAPTTRDGRPGGKKPDPAESAADRELKALQGKWKLVELQENGGQAPPERIKNTRWAFKGAHVEATEDGDKWVKLGDIKLDPSKKPKQLDLVGVGDFEGKTILGIYKLEKGSLTVCSRDPNKGRPTEFTADGPKGEEARLYTLERLEDAPKPEDAEGGATPRPAAAEKTNVTGMQAAQKVAFGPGVETKFEGLAVALLGSCSSETAIAGDKKHWETVLAGEHLLIAFSEPRRYTAVGDGDLTVGEILIPISSSKNPEWVLVRAGDHYRAFAKYEFDVCKALQTELGKITKR